MLKPKTMKLHILFYLNSKTTKEQHFGGDECNIDWINDVVLHEHHWHTHRVDDVGRICHQMEKESLIKGDGYWGYSITKKGIALLQECD